MTTATDISEVSRISQGEAPDLADTEYTRFIEQLRGLSAEDWTKRTDCPDWDVRELAAHVAGACQSCSSKLAMARQLAKGTRWGKRHNRPQIDGINAVQVADRADHTPAQILAELEARKDAAVRGRSKVPGPLRGFDVGDGNGGHMTLGWLNDVIYTRDTWMHRVDLHRATGAPLVMTPEQDGRIVADVVAQWASEHGEAFTLTLHGPAGGRFQHGEGGVTFDLDAIDFMRTMSGRATGEGLLANTVLF